MPTSAALWQCLVLAVAASTISITITQTELFRPLRALTDKIHPMIGYLFKCFYCMSHWVVLLGIAIYRPVLVSSGALLIDLVVSLFATVTLSTLVSGMIFLVFFMKMTNAAKENALSATPPTTGG